MGYGEDCGQDDNLCSDGICIDGVCARAKERDESCGSGSCEPNCDHHCNGDLVCFNWKCTDKRDFNDSCDNDEQCKDDSMCLNKDIFGKGICKFHWDSREKGEICTENNECISHLCEKNVENEDKQCVARQIDASCDYDLNCEVCDEDGECSPGACIEGKCKEPLANDENCETDLQCENGTCFDWKCQDKIALKGSCDRSEQCDDGECLNYFGSRGICKYHWIQIRR